MLRGVLPVTILDEDTVHMIDRDANERYVVVIKPTGVRVFDLAGNEKSVTAPNGWGYLSGITRGDVRALTVQDHTFILNTTKTVLKNSAVTPSRPNEGLIHVVQGDYFTDYKVLINGDVKAHFRTNGGPYADPPDVRRAERGARAGVIAKILAVGMPTDEPDLLGTSYSNLSETLTGPNWFVNVLDNVVVVRNDVTDFTLEVEAGTDSRIRAHKGESKNYAELPRRAPNGFVIKVAGSEDNGYDDFYVKFDREVNSSQGTWKETVAPNIQYLIEATTMPHLLVRNSDGTFTFKAARWAGRQAGDDDTNPWPSFVGEKISGTSFGNNRIGFHSGESLSQSRHGKFFNFWVESILTPLDTDPVDAAISYPDVSTIHHVVPFSGETILFTASVPFRIAKTETLTQKSISYDHLMSNTISSRVRPTAAGEHLYFVNDTPSGCFVHEFSYDRSVDNLKPQCITDHVAGYVPANVTLMEGDGDLKILALVSEDEPQSLYVYKWLWIGNDKAQSAWQKWTLDAPVLAMQFHEDDLVLVTGRDDAPEVLAVNCHEAWVQGGPCAFSLDRQVELLGISYDPESDVTVFTTPFADSTYTVIAANPDDFGTYPTVVSKDTHLLILSGNWLGKPVRVGWPFQSYGILSPLLHRQRNNSGGYGNAASGWQTVVSNVRFGTGDCAFLNVTLDRDYRSPVIYDFSAALSGTKTGTHGKLVIGEIAKSVSVMAKSGDFRLKFGNSGPFPYAILSYGWTGDARPISY
jgi:hypothetical protein